MAEKKATTQTGNMQFYEQLRSVPDGALKKIGAGRLSGMSDINPVWRIQVMTETFGPCGIGWKYEIVKQWFESFTYKADRMVQQDNQWVTTQEERTEIKAFCNINLFVKVNGEWSDPIPGTGGSSFVANEKNGPYVSDECHKMALTDALSVAMKSLGVAANIYFAKGVNMVDTKYVQQQQIATPQQDLSARLSSALMELGACKTQQAVVDVNNKYNDLWENPQFINERDKKYTSLNK